MSANDRIVHAKWKMVSGFIAAEFLATEKTEILNLLVREGVKSARELPHLPEQNSLLVLIAADTKTFRAAFPGVSIGVESTTPETVDPKKFSWKKTDPDTIATFITPEDESQIEPLMAALRDKGIRCRTPGPKTVFNQKGTGWDVIPVEAHYGDFRRVYRGITKPIIRGEAAYRTIWRSTEDPKTVAATFTKEDPAAMQMAAAVEKDLRRSITRRVDAEGNVVLRVNRRLLEGKFSGIVISDSPSRGSPERS